MYGVLANVQENIAKSSKVRGVFLQYSF